MASYTDSEITEELPRLSVALDANRYTDPTRFSAELGAVFGTQWLHAARLDELPQHGALERTVARRPLALTRRDGEVAAMHNVCAHRGSAVVEGTQYGSRLRCPFHGWTYDLSGNLVAVPGRQRFTDLDIETCALPGAHVRVWAGSVWVHLGDGHPAFDDWLAPWEAELSRYRMQDQVTFSSRVDEVAVNWKVALDSFNETYHVPFIHSDTVGRLVHGKASTFRYGGSHSRMVIPLRRRPREGDACGHETAVVHPRHKDLLPEQAQNHVNYTLFPNLIANLLANWGILIAFEPVAVDATRLRTLMIADPISGARREKELGARWEEFQAVLEEDLATLSRLSAGNASPAFETVHLGGEEERLVHFHRMVDAHVDPDRPHNC